ncbi:MAG: D-alanyl-D-alanine carboxypeptidase/D-alanyl-D-alanine-endopeptidase [Myxococcaceae bacterium]
MLKNTLFFCVFMLSFFLRAQSDFDSILNQFKGAQVSFLAASLKTHQVIAEHNSNLLLNPASNIKLVTTLAALEILHPEYRFKTEYIATGPIKAGVLQGDLVVKGYGDPSITNERLQKVARQLKLLGVRTITGSVVLDESYFGGETVPQGWETAPIAALSLNNNTVSFLMRPGEVGEAAVFSPDPPADYFQVQGQIKTVSRAGRPRVGVSDRGQYMQITLGGTLGSRTASGLMRRKIGNPSRYFESVFTYFLKQEGVEIKHALTTSLELKILFVDKSPILSHIVGDTNKTSNNFMAEMLIKAIAGKVSTPARFETGLIEIRKFLEDKVGLKKNSFVLVNGSGLGTYNRFSARQFVMLLEYAQHNFELSSEFVSSLGVAGTQGTLSKRMRQEPTLRSLRAKTGTLTGVSSLSGYVDTNGDDTLIFSILVQGRSGLMGRVRSLQDRIGNSLARLHTAPFKNFVAEDSEEEVSDEELETLSGG